MIFRRHHGAKIEIRTPNCHTEVADYMSWIVMNLKIATIALLACGYANLAFAECGAGFRRAFSCEIPEYNAHVELCWNDEFQMEYNYYAEGEWELTFRPKGWELVWKPVRGVTSSATGMALSNNGTYYVLFVDDRLYWPETDGRLSPSPNPAVLQVYSSHQSMKDPENDRPVVRRVC